MAEYLTAQTYPWLFNRLPQGGQNQTLQAFQVGMQMRQNQLAEARSAKTLEAQLRAIELREQVFQAEHDAKEQVANGHAALGQVLSEISSTGAWTDPGAKAKFWSTAAKYPQLMKDPSFRELTQTFELADRAKQQADLLGQRQVGQIDVETLRQEGRLTLEQQRAQNREMLLQEKISAASELQEDSQEFKRLQAEITHEFNLERDRARHVDRVSELSTRFDRLTEIQDDKQAFNMEITRLKSDLGLLAEDNKQDNRVELLQQRLDGMGYLQNDKHALNLEVRQAQHELDVIRDAKRPHPSSQSRFDLKYTDQEAMKAEYDAIRSDKRMKPEEKTKRLDAIYRKWKAKATETSAPAAPKILKFNPATGAIE